MSNLLKVLQGIVCMLYVKSTDIKERTITALSNEDGDAYIDTVVKILIAVVVGALILWGLYELMGETVMPTLTEKIEDLFDQTPMN